MGITQEKADELATMFEAIEPEIGSLSPWAESFIKDQIERFKKYGTDMYLSPKQWAKIKEAYETITGDRGDDEAPPVDEAPF